MPRLIPFRLAAACAPALILVLCTAAVAVAKGPLVDLRVVGGGGKILTERTLGAATTSIGTSPRARCFGAGTGGSGKPVKIQGPTALGLLGTAAKRTRALRPLLITDAFDFGLGLCGIGGHSAGAKLSWYLKVNHRNPGVGAESAKVRRGDSVLFALVPFPYPAELALVAPNRVKAGKPFAVRVFSYDEKGKRRPVAGAKVSGARSVTAASGRTTVTLKRPARLVARHGKAIPSQREAVCVGGKCPRG